MSVRISVVIPVFEHRAELRACLASLDTQTEPNIEVIIIDDGSKDRIQPSDCEGHAYPVQLLRFDENRGAPTARNHGLSLAKGEYVLFLDADAVLAKDALEVLAGELDGKSEMSFAYPNFRFGKKLFVGKHFDREALRERNSIHTSALIRRSDAIRFDESLTKFQDWDYFLQMSEQGKRGVWIDRELIQFKERQSAGMSRWMPSFAYDLPWHVIGYTPKYIAWYLKADEIIRQKHHLAPRKKDSKGEILFFLTWTLLLLGYAVVARIFPTTNTILALLVTGVFGWVSFRSPVYGLAFMVIEYLIGSKGGILKVAANEVNDGGVGVRQLFFAAYLSLWILKVRWDLFQQLFTDWIKRKPIYLLLIGAISLGVLRGFLLGQPFVFADANSWGVLLLAFPLYYYSKTIVETWLRPLLVAIAVGLGVLALGTSVLFYLYAHDTGAVQLSIYLFIRRSGIGEITRIFPDGSLWRIFLQSQIYWLLAFVGALFSKDSLQPKWRMALLSVGLAVIGISLSRSFFFALGMIGFIWLLKTFRELARSKQRKETWSYLLQTIAGGAGGVGIILILAFFPIPASRNGALDQAFLNRLDTGEAAAQSRWILLPALNKEIVKHPVIGSGFGKTVTYKSADPRIAATGKEYTTYAFEWGWHDLWLKLGMGALMIVAWLLFTIKEIYQSSMKTDLKWGMGMMVSALALVHVFTPYINHPLGILFLIIVGMMIKFITKPSDPSVPVITG